MLQIISSSNFEVDKMCLAEVLVFGDGMSLGNDKRSETHSRLRNSQSYEVFAAAHPCVH